MRWGDEEEHWWEIGRVREGKGGYGMGQGNSSPSPLSLPPSHSIFFLILLRFLLSFLLFLLLSPVPLCLRLIFSSLLLFLLFPRSSYLSLFSSFPCHRSLPPPIPSLPRDIVSRTPTVYINIMSFVCCL